ncbi:hypothetical protein [Pasteuria penetrans]|uniref:hypothetical protein n=1 Tax=Pasteuria penetrans TaxID=86005 RepID=UPI00165C9E01|nr:hypothetical protein [Pasteuria penetrans]
MAIGGRRKGEEVFSSVSLELVVWNYFPADDGLGWGFHGETMSWEPVWISDGVVS